MSFLAPLFLAGAAAVALPVVFHLIRRSTRDRTLFSSLLLLQPTPPRMRRRSRLEDILLLALRCLVLGLLALGFARPFFKDPSLAPPASSATQRIVALVDTSASMQRPGLWKSAVERATQAIRNVAAGDQVSLLTFDRETRTQVSFEAWRSAPVDTRPNLVASALAGMSPGWGSTHLAQALILAADNLSERPDDPPSLVRRIVLISDLQEGARLESLQAFDWPKNVSVQVERVEPDSRSGNASLQLIQDASPPHPSTGNTGHVVRVRIHAGADLSTDRLQVGWRDPKGPGFLGTPEEVRLAAGANRVVALPVPTNAPVDHIELRGDAVPFDNTLHVVPPRPISSRILYLADDPEADPRQPLFFLRRAFPTNLTGAASLEARPPAPTPKPEELRPGLIVATAALPDPTARAVRAVAEEGATVLFAPRSASAETAATLGLLLGRAPVPLEEIQPRSYALLAELDFRHPVLGAFANPKFSDFTKVRFWRHRRLDTNVLAGARVVARFDSGDPAWVEFPVGNGRVLLFAAGWHPDDSQLAVSTKFVPLLVSILESADGRAGTANRAYTVGDVLPLPEPATERTQLRLEAEPNRLLPLAPGATNFTRTDIPGIYAITPPAPPLRFAVNLDPTESRTLPLALEELERHGVALHDPADDAKPTADRAAELAAAEVESRQKLWRWFLVATVIAVFLESTLAGWITRRSAAPSPTAA